MFKIEYPATFKRDENGWYLVGFPDFSRSHTDGSSLSEAMEEAIDCLGSSISLAITHKEEIPKPSSAKRGQKLVPVPFWIAGKLALYWAIREKGMSQSELARRLGVRETVVRRLLDPAHDTRPEKLHAALEALGKRLILTYGDAAA